MERQEYIMGMILWLIGGACPNTTAGIDGFNRAWSFTNRGCFAEDKDIILALDIIREYCK